MLFYPRQQSSLGLATLQMGCVWSVWCILLGSLHNGYQFLRVPDGRTSLEFGTFSIGVSTRFFAYIFETKKCWYNPRQVFNKKIKTKEPDPSKRPLQILVSHSTWPKARNHVEMAGLSHVVTVQLGHSDDAVQMVPQWWNIRDRRIVTFWTCASLLCWLMPFMDYTCPEQLFFGASFWLKNGSLPWQEKFSRGSENTMNPCSDVGIKTSQVLDKFGPRSVDMVPWSRAIACIRC